MVFAKAVPGRIAPRHLLINMENLRKAYYQPPTNLKKVEFGTSGHRGTSLNGSFNEAHILAITQAICEYRQQNNIDGPLFLGFDTHALSMEAFSTALEVLNANQVTTVIDERNNFTPTPVISHEILKYNLQENEHLADGIIITPSHNGPSDGGLKYNPPNGGPAEVEITKQIEKRANELMSQSLKEVKRAATLEPNFIIKFDFITSYVEDLAQVVDLEAISDARLKIGVDPMGGSGISYWGPIAERYKLDLEIINAQIDPQFAFMPLDHDGTIRMDCSSPFAMANLLKIKDRFDIAFGNDPDYDRHGIVCPTGLMNPNHYLSVAIWYLLQNRPQWKNNLKIGKTLVSSSMIDKVVKGLNRELYEVPVGFKWFVQGLLNGTLAFGGEESAGASFLRQNGKVWVTEKDGFIMDLLAAEILAVTGRTPDEIYREILVPQYGNPFYQRKDGSIEETQKKVLQSFDSNSLKNKTIVGLKVTKVLTKASGNHASIGGLKVELEDGSWFALRPSGTEPKMKVYIESFGGKELWEKIYQEALPLIFGK